MDGYPNSLPPGADPLHVLYVGSNDESASIAEQCLVHSRRTYCFSRVRSPASEEINAAASDIDCVLVECEVFDGLIKESPYDLSARRTPIIVIADRLNARSIRNAFRQGALDFIALNELHDDVLDQSIHRARQAQVSGSQFENCGNFNTDPSARWHDAAHRLLTPLSSAQEFVSIVLDELSGPINPKQGKYLAIARGSCQTLAHEIEVLTSNPP